MSPYKARFQLMGLNCLVESDLPFQMVDSFSAFTVEAGEPDLIFELHGADSVDLSGYRFLKTSEGDPCYHIYEQNGGWLMLSYEYSDPSVLRWSITHRSDDPKRYIYHIFPTWAHNLDTFDPFPPLGLPKFLIEHSALLLHASFIRHEGRGILFTAPSGTGKSTQAELWEKYYGAEILNGDRALIRKEDGGYRVYGSPYAGSSYIYRNESAPLSAVFVLKQAKENRIRPMGGKEKFLSLLSQFLLFRRDSEIMDRQIDAITELMDRVPVYLLECRPDREAADLVFDFLKERT